MLRLSVKQKISSTILAFEKWIYLHYLLLSNLNYLSKSFTMKQNFLFLLFFLFSLVVVAQDGNYCSKPVGLGVSAEVNYMTHRRGFASPTLDFTYGKHRLGIGFFRSEHSMWDNDLWHYEITIPEDFGYKAFYQYIPFCNSPRKLRHFYYADISTIKTGWADVSHYNIDGVYHRTEEEFVNSHLFLSIGYGITYKVVQGLEIYSSMGFGNEEVLAKSKKTERSYEYDHNFMKLNFGLRYTIPFNKKSKTE